MQILESKKQKCLDSAPIFSTDWDTRLLAHFGNLLFAHVETRTELTMSMMLEERVVQLLPVQSNSENTTLSIIFFFIFVNYIIDGSKPANYKLVTATVRSH